MSIRSLLASGILLASLPIHASELFKPIELTDPELAQLRGRYVLPNQIISFGVTMSTFWQNSAGQVIGAQVALNIDGQSQPNLTVTPIQQAIGNGSVTIGNGQVIGGAGLDAVQGIAQSVRTAGDLNSGLNDLSITITRNGSANAPASGEAWTGSYSDSNGAGSVNISSVNGGMRVALTANNGQGFAQQQIASGGIAQQADISGSLNAVQNLAALNVALRDSPNLDMATYCAWEQLRGLQRAGY
ncbi:hypothetical protein [Pseudomonas sp. Marseille-Q8238]